MVHQIDLILEGLWSRVLVMVLVFVNRTLYKKKNSFGFSSQVGELLALADCLYSMFLVFLLFMLWYLFDEEHYNNLTKEKIII